MLPPPLSPHPQRSAARVGLHQVALGAPLQRSPLALNQISDRRSGQFRPPKPQPPEHLLHAPPAFSPTPQPLLAALALAEGLACVSSLPHAIQNGLDYLDLLTPDTFL